MKSLIEIAAGNVILVALLYYVNADMAWRGSCTVNFPRCIAPISASANWPFITIYQAVENQMTLTSPPTLNWLEILLFALIVFNGFYAYRAYRHKRPPN